MIDYEHPIDEECISVLQSAIQMGGLYYRHPDGLKKISRIASMGVFEGDDEPEPCAVWEDGQGYCSLIGNDPNDYVVLLPIDDV
jgi:CDP-diacylglycerol pyrophosphatase